ncbi:MAG: DNA polymerase I [Bacilli bacterium]|nr:DNA polymerase I [Bacilli bacterium]
MKKIVLVDGNNLMFRAYYATAYTGKIMTNSKGFPTNALYGFVNMINKIIQEEKPEYMAVAFDIGKTFRHDEYQDYKAGRSKTPDELKLQMPKSREMLEHMGIKHLELEGYEADDIIGTLARMADEDPEWDALLVTSDHDYLQLITDVVNIKLLKQKGFVKYNPKTFFEEYGITPPRVVDLKAIMGDSSDNIPGVKGIGEKGALKLLHEYETLDGIYEHIDDIKGSTHEKLVNDKEQAYFSYKLATIDKNAPIEVEFEDLKYDGPKVTLNDFFKELEFYSLIKTNLKETKLDEKIESKDLEDVSKLGDKVSYYIECDNTNYHNANIIGMALYDGKNSYYVDADKVMDTLSLLKNKELLTFDLKKNICLTKNFNLANSYDLNIATYLLNEIVKDDLGVLMNNHGVEVPMFNDLLKQEDKKTTILKKAKFIYDTHDEYIKLLEKEKLIDLFNDVEIPLSKVLAKMELNGIKCDKDILEDMRKELSKDIKKLEGEIHEFAGVEFNISSPKQLGEVLFEKLGLSHAKKTATGYKTGEEILLKIVDENPIVEKVLEYRKLTKLSSTYLEGLQKFIKEDGKIHTIYQQTLTRTGRLSSTDPNLQNIPTRDDLGKMIRKAFIPEEKEFLSCDYSQIELRVLAHMSGCKALIDSFKKDEDIHTRVASDIYGIPFDEVTKNQRRVAKSVIFGIVYGISGFGLGENIGISPKEARAFINKYYDLYPGVKEYIDSNVESAKETGEVRTLYGRKRVIEEIHNTNFMIRQSGERMAMNTPIQGTAADILKMAMIKIDKEFEKENIESKMLLQIHDELIFDIKSGEEKKVIDIVTNIMENIVKLDVPLKVSHDLGSDLYETK